MPADPRWLPHGTAGRTLRFVDTHHDAPDADSRIAAAFPACDIRTSPLPLREIFVTLARNASTASAPASPERAATRESKGGAMKLVAHLVRADVRRFRLLLAAWVLMEVLNTVFTAVQPALAGRPTHEDGAGPPGDRCCS